ncbi:hypothetical protein B0H19DRAFT_1238652 [Mycena capillaripes]|nr:hypothetical protein B0H19DRAFT_1238652 [Mycena capillaripes]
MEAPVPEGSAETENTVEMSLDGLLRTNIQQFNNLNAALEKLNSAIVSLTPKPESSDKKTAFWTAYKKLADEFDQEFQRKYGNDLDTALLFAGLFSAVSSAFIIQVQPELQLDPSAMMLAILVQNMTGTAPTMMSQTGPPTITVVAQSILYFSLFATLLAALLAVLGKQWLLHYASVGERGTIEERGLERQRKFDGLRRWKFDLMMQIFPLLLQLALLLFAVALALYLWTINHAIAAIIIGLTVMCFIQYAAMVFSALAYPDSPFQTSLTTLLRVGIDILPTKTLWSLHNFFTATGGLLRTTVSDPLHNSFAHTRSAYSRFTKTIAPLLPQFNKTEPSDEPTTPQPTRNFDNIPPPSNEVPAIVWALETSTDPKIVEAAAALTPNLQWPVDLDLRSSLKRLSDAFNQCFTQRGNRRHRTVVLDGMRDRSISCLKAFGVLEMIAARHEGWSDLWSFQQPYIYETDSELESSVRFFRVPHFDSWFYPDTPPITQWSLRFISAQNPSEKHLATLLKFFRPAKTSLDDLSLLADFLFCLNSFFVPPDLHDLSLMDKSEHCNLLLTLLFENLAKRLTDGEKPLNLNVATSIVEQILKFKFSFQSPGQHSRFTDAVYRFCAVPGQEFSAIISVLRLVRLDQLRLHLIQVSENNPIANAGWAYRALEHLDASQFIDPAVVGDFLQVLLHRGHVRARPTTAVLRTILWALSCDSRRTNLLACIYLLLPSLHHWFLDDMLRPILQQNSAWTSLGVVLVQAHMIYPPTFIYPMSTRYITLGDKISRTSEWRPVVAQDLPGWLANLTVLLGGEGEARQLFCAVLSRLWNADDAEGEEFGDEKALAMSFAAVASAWDRFDFSITQGIHPLLRFIECTVSTAFCARLVDEYRNTISDPSPRFKDIIMPRLGDAVARAVERSKAAVTPDLNDAVTDAAEILSKLASTINGELKNRPPCANDWDRRAEIGYWRGLQTGFEKDIKALPGFHQQMSLISEVPDI